MKKNLLVLTGVLFLCQLVYAQPQPKREFRGAWVATYFGIDWPNRNQTPQQQRDAFIAIANHHQQAGITALFVQVRSQSDAMYPSEIEPWGFYLTPLKKDGNEPSEAWDPMQFMIDECHKRGIEFHAWLNPYRAIGNIANTQYFSPDHVSRKHPEWLLTSNLAEKILDPGIPEVREHINKVVAEIVEKYDVDGIQFDDYFYPNAVFNDDVTFANYNRGFTNRADWRRDNINLMVELVSQNIKAIKPWVEFGISPSGIWRNGGEGSATTGLQHYVTLYADSRKWLQEGWVDYLCPQVYWYIGQPGADYKVLIPWWNNNAYGRLIYIGLAGYKVGAANQGFFTTDRTQIPRQVRMNRDAAFPNIHGQAVYNTSSLRGNSLNFRDSLQHNFYHLPALQPLMPWIDHIPPEGATELAATYTGGNTVTLNWTNPAEATAEMDKVKRLVIYRSESKTAGIEDAANILAITNSAVTTYTDATVEAGKVYYYRVTTLDRLHNESIPTQQVIVCTSVPQIVSCTPTVKFCEVSTGNYTIPAMTASSNCEALTYTYTITGTTNRTGTGSDASGSFLPGVSIIDWSVTDAAGNTANCQTVVTIHTNPVATIPDVYVLPSGVLPNTVYKGYAPAESITLTAKASGGLAPYTYSWSSGSTEATATVSPVAITSYLLTVRDENGCQATADKEITVIDVNAGKNNNKVKVCHASAGFTTLEISTEDVTDHLAHGDRLGACATNIVMVTVDQPSSVERSMGRLLIRAYPNPSAHYFSISLQGRGADKTVSMRVMDIMGRTIEQQNNLPVNHTLRVGEKYMQGIYFIEISNGADKTMLKLIKQ